MFEGGFLLKESSNDCLTIGDDGEFNSWLKIMNLSKGRWETKYINIKLLCDKYNLVNGRCSCGIETMGLEILMFDIQIISIE